MKPLIPTGHITVGIDGSEAASQAAVWAASEAASRCLALRLVIAVPADLHDLADASQSLAAAATVIEKLGSPVKVTTAIKAGQPSAVLLDESSMADLVCLGSVGVNPIAAAVLGSTAIEVARWAHCPVAIIRWDRQRPPDRGDWVAVAVNASREDEFEIETAMDFARRHRLRVLAVGVREKDFGASAYDELDRRIAAWQQRYPDVHVRAVATGSGIADHLAGHTESVRMVVIDTDDIDQIATIIGPPAHPLIAHGDCSILVARH